MKRFCVVAHSDHKKKLSVHHLFGSYHWQAIDENYVLCLADVPQHHGTRLLQHPDVLVLPSVLAGQRNLRDHAHALERMGHYSALTKLGVEDHHTVTDLARIAQQTFGGKFELGI